MPIFEIEPDIRKAHTLPSEFYLSREYFDLAKERIFGRSWHLIGRSADLRTLTPVEILGEPMLAIKTDAGVSCVSNVCTHRGKLLVDEPCDASLIRCGYHGRRFSLEGRFLSMPEFDGVENFPAVSDDLPSISAETGNGFVFVSFDPVAPINEFIPDGVLTVDDRLILSGRQTYEVNAHWALYCENYLEGFHIPFVHNSLNEAIDYGQYTTETFRYSSVQTAVDKDGRIAGRYGFIFPNLMFNVYPWGLSVNIVRPVTSELTHVEYVTYVADASLLGEGAGVDLHRVELEDEAVVESVQRGIRSRFYDRGRYSPTREQGTHHFHRLISEFMG